MKQPIVSWHILRRPPGGEWEIDSIIHGTATDALTAKKASHRKRPAYWYHIVETDAVLPDAGRYNQRNEEYER